MRQCKGWHPHCASCEVVISGTFGTFGTLSLGRVSGTHPQCNKCERGTYPLGGVGRTPVEN